MSLGEPIITLPDNISSAPAYVPFWMNEARAKELFDHVVSTVDAAFALSGLSVTYKDPTRLQGQFKAPLTSLDTPVDLGTVTIKSAFKECEGTLCFYPASKRAVLDFGHTEETQLMVQLKELEDKQEKFVVDGTQPMRTNVEKLARGLGLYSVPWNGGSYASTLGD